LGGQFEMLRSLNSRPVFFEQSSKGHLVTKGANSEKQKLFFAALHTNSRNKIGNLTERGNYPIFPYFSRVLLTLHPFLATLF
jgi:hypothetical protein